MRFPLAILLAFQQLLAFSMAFAAEEEPIRNIACRRAQEKVLPKIQAKFPALQACLARDAEFSEAQADRDITLWGKSLSSAQVNELLMELADAWVASMLAPKERVETTPPAELAGLALDFEVGARQRKYIAKEAEILRKHFPRVRYFRDVFMNPANLAPSEAPEQFARNFPDKSRFVYSAKPRKLSLRDYWNKVQPDDGYLYPTEETSRVWTHSEWYHGSMEYQFAGFQYFRASNEAWDPWKKMAQGLEGDRALNFSVCAVENYKSKLQYLPCVFVSIPDFWVFLGNENGVATPIVKKGAVSIASNQAGCEVPQLQKLVMGSDPVVPSVSPELTLNQYTNRLINTMGFFSGLLAPDPKLVNELGLTREEANEMGACVLLQ